MSVTEMIGGVFFSTWIIRPKTSVNKYEKLEEKTKAYFYVLSLVRANQSLLDEV